MVRSFWALGLVLFLAACAGGGSGLPTVDPSSTQSLTGLQPPGFSDSEIVRIVNQVLASADAILVSDVAVGQGQDAGVFYTYCDTKTICVTEIDGGYAFSWDVRDIKDSGLDRNLNYSGVGEKYGVSLVQGQGRSVFAGIPVSATSYGAWLDHSAFILSLERITGGTLAGVDLSGVTVGYSQSVGNDSGTWPSGSATWRGIMVGGTGDIAGDIDVIQGDATVTYDIRRDDLDVYFTNVYNLDTRARFMNLRWSALSVDADGSFYQLTATREIHGRFYGPSHAEVGGIFTHPEAIGAFGAKR